MSTDRLLELVEAGGIAYWNTLGLTIDSVEVGIVRLRLPIRPMLGTRRPEIMHGGAISSLIDAAAGAATATLRDEQDETWNGHATTDLNVTFLSASTTDLVAEAHVLRSTRAFSFVSVEVRNTDDKLVAVGRATYAIIRRR